METIIVQKLRLQNENFMAGYRQMGKDKSDFPVDIFEGERKIRLIAELPGINKEEDIKIYLNERVLVIFASGKDKSYYKNIKLPSPSENIIGKLYNGGFLEIILEKKENNDGLRTISK
ncbi:MAG: hypothetical protein Q7J27_06465 [Syntrophales bacterium]|nr:hypothetical protein [Syntrophales bacterium]